MSAIAGLSHFDGNPNGRSDCERMLRALALYGPDRSRCVAQDGVAMGHCLSKLLPEDAFDAQPVTHNGDILAADIRLYNRDELIGQLRLAPSGPNPITDCAVLQAALERWGEEAVDRLIGDFAFAWWDSRRRRLLLARDPFGQRPLYFHRGKDFFAFASMPKGLHALADIPYAPDLDRLEHLFALVPFEGSRTFFAGIEKVHPGHLLVANASGIAMRRHWNPVRQVLQLKRAEDYAEALKAQIDQAIACRLRGVGDVATHLSGGRDSTTVTAMAARQQAARGKRVVALTAVPRAGYPEIHPGRFGDEGAHAAAVARLYPNIEHVLVRPSRRDPTANFDRDFLLYEKPIFNPCNNVWDSAIDDEVKRRGIRVLLPGQCGNFTISYGGEYFLAELLATGRLRHWWREAVPPVLRGQRRWKSAANQTLAPFLPTWLWQAIHSARNGRSRTLLPASGLRAQRAERFVARYHANFQPKWDGWANRLRGLQKMDSGNENLGMIAGWQIETRDPTMDRRLVEFCLSVPTEYYLRDGQKSALLRQAMRGILPDLVLDEERRGLQAIDWHEGMTEGRHNLAAELERLAACAPVAKLLDVELLQAAVTDWPAEGWEKGNVLELYRLAMLRGLAVGHFTRRVIRANG